MSLVQKYLYRRCYTIYFLIGVILYLCMSFSTHAADKSGTCGDNLTWTLTDSTLTITGSGDMTDYADGALAPWFGQARDIQMIQLPEGMTSVGDYAFMGCEGVTSIVIPESVTEIGECAFSQCRSLIFVDLGNNLQIIGEGAFQECESLPWINIPASVTEIRAKAFYRCYSMIAGNTPETVKVLGESVFSYCTDMVRAVINAPIEELPSWTFYGCKSLADVSLAPEIVSVGDYAFLFCENLNGIYTQGGNVETVHALEESIYSKDGAPKEGLVKAYEMPVSSTVETDDGKIYTQMNVTQAENITVLVRKITEYEGEKNVSSTEVGAVVTTSEDWKMLSETAKELNSEEELMLMKIYFFGDVVESESLEYFAGSPVVLQILSKTGAVWEIDMSQMNLSSFTGQYILEEMAVRSDSLNEEVIPENEGTKELPIFEPYDASSVDADTSDLETVDSNPETSNLTDEEGTTYYISKRSSKWGITLKQFSVYVALWIASAVLIVAVIMLTLNQKKKSKEQYEELVKQGEAEDAAAEEALKLEIMKEMLNKKK